MLWLGRPGLVAATGSWLASSDYLPKVKSGQMARVLPIYLKLRKGFQRRSLVDCSPASKNTKGKQSAVVVRLNWAMFLELVNRCAAGAAADSDEEEGAEGRGTTEGELGVHGEPEPESDGLMVMGSKDVAAPVPLPLFLASRPLDEERPEVTGELSAGQGFEGFECSGQAGPVVGAVGGRAAAGSGGRAAAGQELCREYLAGLLWNISMMRTGVCPDYGYVYRGGSAAPSFRQLSAFLASLPKADLAGTSGTAWDPRAGMPPPAPPLSPLQFCLSVLPADAKPGCCLAVQTLMAADSDVADVFTNMSLDPTSADVAARLAAALAALPAEIYGPADGVWLLHDMLGKDKPAEEAYYSRHGPEKLQIKLPPPPPSLSKLSEKKTHRIRR